MTNQKKAAILALQANKTPEPGQCLSLRDIAKQVRAEREIRRKRKRTAAAKAAANAPAWAQRIWEAQRAHDRFWQLCLETMKFAETKGYDLGRSEYGGYDLRRDKSVVLRGRPMFKIVEYLGAQEIWEDV
jgi:uncharacterized membrane-anchored protein